MCKYRAPLLLFAFITLIKVFRQCQLYYQQFCHGSLISYPEVESPTKEKEGQDTIGKKIDQEPEREWAKDDALFRSVSTESGSSRRRLYNRSEKAELYKVCRCGFVEDGRRTTVRMVKVARK